MPTDTKYLAPQFYDGEGLEPTDLSAFVPYIDRGIDFMATPYIGVHGETADPDIFTDDHVPAGSGATQLIHTATGGNCVVMGAGALQVRVMPGTMFQHTSGDSSAAPRVLPFYLASPVTLTLSPGSGSPRVDIVQVRIQKQDGRSDGVAAQEARDFQDAMTGAWSSQLFYTRKMNAADISIKQGIPAATPVYPIPDAGYAALAAIRVPASHSGAFDAPSGHLRQLSIPLRTEAITVHPHEFDYGHSTVWSRVPTGLGMGAAVASGIGDLLVWAPRAGSTKRVVGLTVYGQWTGTPIVQLRTAIFNGLTGYASEANHDLTASLSDNSGSLFQGHAMLNEICAASADTLPAALAYIGDPYWASGSKAGPSYQPVTIPGDGKLSRAYLRIVGGNLTRVAGVTWYLAG